MLCIRERNKISARSLGEGMSYYIIKVTGCGCNPEENCPKCDNTGEIHELTELGPALLDLLIEDRELLGKVATEISSPWRNPHGN